MIEFRYHVIKEDLVSCDVCSCEAPLHQFGGTLGHAKSHLLCEVCSSTFIGNQIASPGDVEAYGGEQILVCMAQVANLLLDKLTSRLENALDGAIELPEESDDEL